MRTSPHQRSSGTGEFYARAQREDTQVPVIERVRRVNMRIYGANKEPGSRSSAKA